MLRRPLALALVMTLGGVAAPSASAIPFGADLTRSANVNFDCTVLPGPPPFGPGFTVLPSNAATCTWINVGSVANSQAGSFLAPAGGTVTRIAVRVGPATGPMQVVVMRAFRDANSLDPPVCCTEVARTPVFTPAANAVTTLATALPVRKDVVPDPVSNTLTFDALGLSVLAPGVPIPAFDVGDHNPGNLNIPSAVVHFPAIAPGQEAFLNTGVGGFQVLMAADVTPGAAGAAAIAIPVGAVRVANGATRVPIRCTLLTGRCIGTVRLQSGAPAAVTAGAATVKKLKTYGKAKVRIRAGHRAKVRVRLNRAGRALVRRHRRAKVYVNVTVGGKRAAKRVTLKR
jgi:hypothetical protein